MAVEVEILRRRDTFSPRPDRMGKQDRITIYKLTGDTGPSHFVVLPVEGWTEQKEQAAIRAAEQETAGVTGKKFTL